MSTTPNCCQKSFPKKQFSKSLVLLKPPFAVVPMGRHAQARPHLAPASISSLSSYCSPRSCSIRQRCPGLLTTAWTDRAPPWFDYSVPTALFPSSDPDPSGRLVCFPLPGDSPA